VSVPGLWRTPALSKRHLCDALSPGRGVQLLRRQLDRAFLSLESASLIEPFVGDDNVQTHFREVSSLGLELLQNRAYREYLGGLPTVVKRWRSSVVKIYHPTDKGIGTGFLVTPTIVATARHVVDDLGKFVVATENGTVLAYKSVRRHTVGDIDVAVIELSTPSAAQPFVLKSGHDLLDEVVVMGYPPIPKSSDAYLVANRGEVSAEIKLQGEDHEMLIVSCLLRGGNSGGPVVNRRGHVLGIVSRNLEHRLADDEQSLIEGLGYAMAYTSEWILDLLT
jgi:S1-C subfamily serine protease